ELPEVAADPRYATAEARVSHEALLMPLLRAAVKGRTMADLDAALTEGDVLHAPVNDYRRYFDDAHVAATSALAWVDHPHVGRIPFHRTPGLPQPAKDSAAARSPLIGEHTRAVLAELGLTAPEIAALESSGAVRASAPGDR